MKEISDDIDRKQYILKEKGNKRSSRESFYEVII